MCTIQIPFSSWIIFALKQSEPPIAQDASMQKAASQKAAPQDTSLQEPFNAGQMQDNARRTTDFLKSLAHSGRLMILCRLVEGPATVGELEEMLSMRQSSVSKQLARLREEGLVDYQRDGRSISYSLADDRARKIVSMLYDLFCG